MKPPDVTLFVGGSIGTDPRGARTWSGSSAFLVDSLERQGVLRKAIGIDIGRVRKSWLMAANFRPSRTLWRKHLYFDTSYRHAMTRAAARVPVDSEFCLQAGHQFNLAEAFPSRRSVSYHDGNLAELVRSGFGLTGVSGRRIDEALRYEEQTAGQMVAVLTFSEYLRQSFIDDYHVPAGRVFTVGGGVNFRTIPPEASKDYSRPQVLFIGIEFDRKGGPVLLDAFGLVRKRIPDAELHIVGPARIDRILPGVVFHGRLSKTDAQQSATLESLFRQCNLFVLPSLYEPFGIAPLEAMLYRVPCVLTDAWAFRQFVDGGRCGLLAAKGSADDVAAKMIELLSDPDRLAVLGQSAREHALANYTWPAVAHKIAQVLQSLGGLANPES